MLSEGNAVDVTLKPSRENQFLSEEIPKELRQAVLTVFASVEAEIEKTKDGHQRDVLIERAMTLRLRDNPDWEITIGTKKYGGEEAYELFKHLRAQDNLRS